MVDFPETRTPSALRHLLEEARIEGGKPIGVYRIVAQGGLPVEIWEGKLGNPVEEANDRIDDTSITVRRYRLGWKTLVERLTFGAFGPIFDLQLPADAATEFWAPRIVDYLGITTADRINRRFFNYLELLRHVDTAAWDARSA